MVRPIKVDEAADEFGTESQAHAFLAQSKPKAQPASHPNEAYPSEGYDYSISDVVAATSTRTETTVDQRNSRNSEWFSSVKSRSTRTATRGMMKGDQAVSKPDEMQPLSPKWPTRNSTVSPPQPQPTQRVQNGAGIRRDSQGGEHAETAICSQTTRDKHRQPQKRRSSRDKARHFVIADTQDYDSDNSDEKSPLSPRQSDRGHRNDADPKSFASSSHSKVSKLFSQKRTKDPTGSLAPQFGVSKRNSEKLAQLKNDAKKRDGDWQTLNRRHKQERANLKIVDDNDQIIGI